MPIISWTPSKVTVPCSRAFRPAAAAAGALAKATAPGPETRAKTKISFRGGGLTGVLGGGFQSATIDALGVGPEIFPIVSGSAAGERTTSGYFVIPGGPVVQSISHPGTPPHDWLRRAAAAFPGLYGASVGAALRLFR